MTSRYQKRRSERLRWSKNSVAKRERNRIEGAALPLTDEIGFVPTKIKKARFDLKINLERHDGGRLQFTLHHFYGKLIGQNLIMSPKQFGRKLGEIFEIWMME